MPAMAGRLLPAVLAVLAGIIVIVVGGRAFLRGRRGPAGGGAAGTGLGALAILIGSLVVTVAVPPTLDELFPPEDAGTITDGRRTPEPTPGTAPGAPDTGAPPSAEPSPPTPAPQAAAPLPTAAPAPEAATPAAPPSPSPSRSPRPARKTAKTTPAPAPPAAEVAPPAAVPSPEAPSPEAPAPPPPPPVLTLAVSCTGLEPEMGRGDTFTMTYRIESPEPRRVGLGAALLDAEGDDHADGSGDRASFELPAGTTMFSRPVAVHDDLSRRRYEVVGGLWPENEVASRDAQPLREASCGSFEVVD
jgi:hypothetical protein